MRKRKPQKRYYQPDPRFGDENVTFFVNNLMLDGKKTIAYKIFYDAMDYATEKAGEDGYELWKKALVAISPGVEVKSRRIGGATFQIPSEVRPARKRSVGMKWLIKYARARNGKSMAEKLGSEIMAAAKGEGAAVKKREDTQRMAEANKAFSHFKF
ncbi:MAG: 30S ribosomal protein S7 [Chitinophagales bacterium]|jgi:small subunit ribosomal protein S7|nr:30S ribosomal protein S7 [Chitinophagales bacterium]|tara:strand:+ start:893 stop:1360 length:468 start_codon:yes stop_codon:yes gene_type:complete